MAPFGPALLILPLLVPAAPAVPNEDVSIKDAYIVVLKDGKPDQVDARVKGLLDRYPGAVEFTYREALQGFAVTMPADTVAALRQDPEVAYVEPQQELTLAYDQPDAPWGIASIDQRTGLDFVYSYNNKGIGVHAYVVDSGIRQSHTDFGGRASGDVSFVPYGIDTWGTNDCEGHGTAMAGIIGGAVHGVAKQVRLHTVRVGGCVGGATTARLLAATDWLAVNAVRPAVVNMSLQGRASDAVDAAVVNLINRGITIVAAAGNADMDACGFSPSRVPGVITVGAIHAFRDRVENSSWGPCVDLFAPGESIPTVSNASDTATTVTGGTSAATAHVTGAVARYLERFPTAWPALVQSTLTGEATRDRMTDPHGSPNLVLYVDPWGPGNDGFGRTGADVNGDGRDDIVTFVRGTPADVYVALSDGASFGPGTKWHEYFAAGNEVPMLGDVNGDGRDDLITFTRGAAANVYVALSTGTSFGPSTLWHDWFAAFTETPLVGDFNGDGRDDIATLTRGTSNDVYVALSDGTRFNGVGVMWSGSFGGADDAVLTGDFNGDGRDDLVSFGRGTLGRATVATSTGTAFATPVVWRDGLVTGTQVPVVGDFNGDGADDVAAVNRGATPTVYVSLANRLFYGFGPPAVWHFNFAGGVAVPGAGDFNGDHRADLVAFTRGLDADVYVALARLWDFEPGHKWHDWFAFGSEVPMPASLW